MSGVTPMRQETRSMKKTTTPATGNRFIVLQTEDKAGEVDKDLYSAAALASLPVPQQEGGTKKKKRKSKKNKTKNGKEVPSDGTQKISTGNGRDQLGMDAQTIMKSAETGAEHRPEKDTMKTDQINAGAPQWQEELRAFDALQQSGCSLQHEEAKSKSHQEVPGEAGRSGLRQGLVIFGITYSSLLAGGWFFGILGTEYDKTMALCWFLVSCATGVFGSGFV